MSTLTLKGATSGSSVLKAPDSGSNEVTFTMPASAGTVLSDASTLDATKLSGNLPAISGANLTGLTSSLSGLTDTTVSASDPAIDTNPSATGHYWVNKTSGECYVCTDVTTDENVWTNIGSGTGDVEPLMAATGGTITTYSVGGNDYEVNTFTSSGTLTVTGSGPASILLVAGGGGASGGYQSPGGGGGGAGGFVYYSATTLNAGTYTVVVGAGGAGGFGDTNGSGYTDAASGVNSSFTGLTTAVGGGAGAGYDNDAGSTGGSGGGGSYPPVDTGYAGTSNQGNAGGDGSSAGQHSGGGGGASAAAADAGSGGPSAGGAGYTEGTSTVYDFSTSGTATFHINGTGNGYAGGGGGAVGYHADTANSSYGAATHGGGQGGINTGSDILGQLRGYSGTANTGGGGGGAGGIIGTNLNSTGGSGGSGIVIVRYLT